MEVIIDAGAAKHRRRFKRWLPFVDRAIHTLAEILSRKDLFPKKLLLRAKRPRHIISGVGMCMEWGRYGHCRTEDAVWISMDMSAPSHKFKDTLLHEIAHIGADVAYGDPTHSERWTHLYKELKKRTGTHRI